MNPDYIADKYAGRAITIERWRTWAVLADGELVGAFKTLRAARDFLKRHGLSETKKETT